MPEGNHVLRSLLILLCVLGLVCLSPLAGIPGLFRTVSAAETPARTTRVAGGGNFSLARRPDGSVWAWGSNHLNWPPQWGGQLGDGNTFACSTVPGRVPGLENVLTVAAGSFHSLALTEDGKVWSWGLNDHGQLGDGTTESRGTPAQVLNLTDVVAIAAGSRHSLALEADGTIWSWGMNSHGQLGDGTATHRYTPAKVTGLSKAVAIACGMTHSLAITDDGSVWAWGQNLYGQLGDGTREDRRLPTKVPGVNHTWQDSVDETRPLLHGWR